MRDATVEMEAAQIQTLRRHSQTQYNGIKPVRTNQGSVQSYAVPLASTAYKS